MSEIFHYKTLSDIRSAAEELHADVHFSDDISALLKPRKVSRKTAYNSMAVLPMEGCDSLPDGTPSDLQRGAT
jgi:2,4-dienoyl-CoA reductase (NADPH2)